MNQIALSEADATQKVTGQQQALAQAEQNAQVDPIIEVKEKEIAQKAQGDALRAQVDQAKIESQEAIAEMKVAQDREEALLKAQNESNKTYGQILKDGRSADTKTKGD